MFNIIMACAALILKCIHVDFFFLEISLYKILVLNNLESIIKGFYRRKLNIYN